MSQTLTPEQMQARVDACTRMKEMLATDADFLKRVVTCGQTWIYYANPTKKKKSSGKLQKVDGRKSKKPKSVNKVMLMAFFDYQGMIYQHYVPRTEPETIIDAEYYVRVLRTLREHLQRKRSDIAHSWILHHDNSPPHSAAAETQDFLEKFEVMTLPYPADSPDLCPCDYGLFPALKQRLRDRKLTSDKDVTSNIKSILEKLPSTEYENIILKKWKQKWNKCLAHEGRYFEKDKTVWNHMKFVQYFCFFFFWKIQKANSTCLYTEVFKVTYMEL